MNVLSVELLEPRLLLATLIGPDPTFGAAGHSAAAADLGMTLLSDGKILTVGDYPFDDDPAEDGETVEAARLTPDGQFDASFGDNGKIDFGQDVSPAGVVGSDFWLVNGLGNEGVLELHNEDGDLVSSFSADGKVPVTDLIPSVKPHVAEIDVTAFNAMPGGGFLVATSELFTNPKPETADYFVKLKADGSIDKTFGANGFVKLKGDPISLVTSHGILAVTIGPDGASENIVRYKLDGTPDTSFGDQGSATIPFLLSTWLEQPDGKILIAPSLDPQRADTANTLLRLNVDGSLDTTFGNNGAVMLGGSIDDSFFGVATLAVDGQNRIYVGGKTIYRLSPTGQLDGPPFDGTLVDNNGAGISATQILFDTQGRLLVAAGFVERLAPVPPVSLLGDRLVHVVGTESADAVTIASAAGNKIAVTLNGDTTEFDASAVTGFITSLLDGNDALSSTVDLPTTVLCGDGNDTVTTGDGADSINTGDGADSISTNGGDDTITLGNGDKTVDLGDGNDSADAESETGISLSGNDTITGGNGNKQINEILNGSVTLTLGVGDNSIYVDNGVSPVHITIAGGNNTVGLDGDGNNVVQIGGDGRNAINLISQGNFDITTGDGDDAFTFDGALTGTFRSNGGNDTFSSDAPTLGPVTIFAGAGNDSLTIDRTTNSRSDIVFHGGDGNDYALAGAGPQSLYGDAGNDTLFGGGGADLLSGGGGNDRLFGEAGDDRLYGGDGRDRLFGGADDDQLFGGAAGDWLYSQNGNDNMNGEGGLDRLYADYDSGVATLHGGAGDDVLVTRDANVDHLFGDGGNDSATADSTDVLTGIEFGT